MGKSEDHTDEDWLFLQGLKDQFYLKSLSDIDKLIEDHLKSEESEN